MIQAQRCSSWAHPFSQSCCFKISFLYLALLYICPLHSPISSRQQAIILSCSSLERVRQQSKVSAKVIKHCPASRREHAVKSWPHLTLLPHTFIVTLHLSSCQSLLKWDSRAVPRCWRCPAIHHPQHISRNKLLSPSWLTSRLLPLLHLPKRMLMTSFTSCQSNAHLPLRHGGWSLEVVQERSFGGKIIMR